MRIAFAGNPNSGKTTMYNALTGRNEHVGNWAGVTVERKESPIKKSYYNGTEEIVAVDLPGAYSMSPFTSEESITSAYVKNEKPDAIINIVDATNLSRSLFFTTQLLELGIPVVVALNKSDLVEKIQTKIVEKLLSEMLGCPVIKTVSASSGHEGLKEAVQAAAELAGTGQKAPYVQAEIDWKDKAAVEAEDRKRFAFVNSIVKQAEKRKIFTKDKNIQDKIDAIITHKIIGIPIFVAVIFLVFYISQTTLGTWIADWLVGWIEAFQGWAGGKMENASPLLYALLVDGIIGGVGAVVGFLPLVMVMYFLIALLEDCGYMARATVVLDPIFKRVGLSGKSVIPMVIGTGCAIPGVMACRTIRNERERRTTAMLTPFMPCGAKIPVIALFAGAFFADAWWVSGVMYLTGILLVLLGALLVKKITGQKYRKSFFIIELPEYKIPSLKRACISMLERGKAYIVKAGTIILVCNTAVQIMQSFNWQLQLIEEGAESTSILASLAHPFALLFIPLGFGAWQLAAAAVTGFIAKENVVGTLAVVYGVTNLIDTEELALIGSGSEVAAVMGLTKAAALGAMNSEMKSGKWLLGGICLQLGTGYTVAFLVYQIGTWVTTGSPGTAFVPGLIAVLVFALIVLWRIRKSDKEFASEYSLHAAQS